MENFTTKDAEKEKHVGWVERSETHQCRHGTRLPMGFALLNPSYDLLSVSSW
jgi:hypothetical protein